jgi:hypothetical protein
VSLRFLLAVAAALLVVVACSSPTPGPSAVSGQFAARCRAATAAGQASLLPDTAADEHHRQLLDAAKFVARYGPGGVHAGSLCGFGVWISSVSVADVITILVGEPDALAATQRFFLGQFARHWPGVDLPFVVSIL